MASVALKTKFQPRTTPVTSGFIRPALTVHAAQSDINRGKVKI